MSERRWVGSPRWSARSVTPTLEPQRSHFVLTLLVVLLSLLAVFLVLNPLPSHSYRQFPLLAVIVDTSLDRLRCLRDCLSHSPLLLVNCSLVVCSLLLEGNRSLPASHLSLEGHVECFTAAREYFNHQLTVIRTNRSVDLQDRPRLKCQDISFRTAHEVSTFPPQRVMSLTHFAGSSLKETGGFGTGSSH